MFYEQGKVPLLSLEALHQLHIFIFVLAVVHVIFCATTMLLASAKVLNSLSLSRNHRSIIGYSYIYYLYRYDCGRDGKNLLISANLRNLKMVNHYSNISFSFQSLFVLFYYQIHTILFPLNLTFLSTLNLIHGIKMFSIIKIKWYKKVLIYNLLVKNIQSTYTNISTLIFRGKG